MAFSVGGLLLGLINEIRINLPLSQELIDRIDAALSPEKYRTGLIREALRRELETREGEAAQQGGHRHGGKAPKGAPLNLEGQSQCPLRALVAGAVAQPLAVRLHEIEKPDLLHRIRRLGDTFNSLQT
jgi:hypothetical protein